jgi:hypothetical protein
VTAAEEPEARRTDEQEPEQAALFDRQMVLDQLGGWRGMLDATVPTVAFIVANSIGGMVTGIWAAVGAAVLIFLLRLVRRESVQQAVSGLLGVAIAVAIAAWTGQARNYFVPGIVRNTAIAVVLFVSVALRRPLVGYAAEFFAPSHLGAMASASFPGLRGRVARVNAAVHHRPPPDPGTPQPVDLEPERHWRDDPRALRAYGWLTVMWAATFALRVVVQTPLYLDNQIELLGTVSLVLGLPVTAVALAVTLWVVAGLHRHRTEPAPDDGVPASGGADEAERPAA